MHEQLATCPPALILKQYVDAEASDHDNDVIDEHIETCSACRSAVENLLSKAVTYGSVERLLRRHAVDSVSSPPDMIGAYHVLREVGRGAYGAVYQARDTTLDRYVAIKVPHASVVEASGGVEGYLKEARVLAKLEHSHIVRIYEASADDSNSCYLVSQYIAGRSLDLVLAEHRLNMVESVALVASIADALQHAHEQGVWHRDVKPANILLSHSGEAFLADFGLALREHEIGQGAGFAGTPAYMSPEQARGEGNRVDGRTDIYSLGIVFHKLLTGRRPFLADSVATLLSLIANVEPPSVRQKDRSIPRELERICAKANALDLSQRYSSAGDLAEDLNAWLRKNSARGTPNNGYAHQQSIPAGSKSSGSATIGEFELRCKLGQGGMGVVHRAYQPSADREVALKCLTLEDDDAQTRFATEIRALGKVVHPNLVRVYTSGVDEDRFYYAMELIDGTGFRHLLGKLPHDTEWTADSWRNAVNSASDTSHNQDGTLSSTKAWSVSLSDAKQAVGQAPAVANDAHKSREYVRRIAAIMRDIAGAAAALHEAGIAHRDIKPDNIMLTRDGERAVLMDLGVAKLLNADDCGVTRTRQFVGSIRYASPEQIIDSGQVDHRTDVYSLGATLWELLTLRPMYEIEGTTSDAKAMLKIQVEDSAPVRRHNNAVPADLDAVIQKCLEKRAADRYQSAAELVDDLDRWLSDQPVKARPITVFNRLVRRARRRPLVSAMMLIIVALGFALCGFIMPADEEPSKEMTIGIKPWVGYSPLVVAVELGLCEDVDIELVPVLSTADTRRKVLAKELDIAPYLMNSHALAQAERTPTDAILQLDVSLTADAMYASGDIQSFDDLRGKTVAYIHHEAPHFLLLSLCEKHGLSTDDFVHLKTETPMEAVNLFVEGRCDAVVCYEPFLEPARTRSGAHRLASAADVPGAIIDILTVRSEYLEKHPEKVESLIRGWFAGLALLRNEDQEALRIACEFLGGGQAIDTETYHEMAAGMRYGGRRENVAFFQHRADGSSNYSDRFNTIQHRWDRHHQLSRRTNPVDSERSDVMLRVVAE